MNTKLVWKDAMEEVSKSRILLKWTINNDNKPTTERAEWCEMYAKCKFKQESENFKATYAAEEANMALEGMF